MNPNLRKKALSEWRGYTEPPPEKPAAKTIQESLGKLLNTLGLGERVREDEIQKVWKDIVGEFLAVHSLPHQLKDGILQVHVLQPTVLYELDRVHKAQILKKLKEHFGAKKIRDIRFRIG